MFQKLALAIALLALTGCGVGQIFGPPTARVTISVSSRLPGDTLYVDVNGNLLDPPLTPKDPTIDYWVRVQVVQEDNYRYDYGTAYVTARRSSDGKNSRVKQVQVRTDKVSFVEFTKYDF